MSIKEITPEEALEIRHTVLWPNKPKAFCKLEDDQKGFHYGYFVEGKLVTTASVFIKNGSARLRKFATLKEYQGRGYGTQVLNFIIDELKGKKAAPNESDATLFWCDARHSAKDFYTKFGMKPQGEIFYKSEVQYIVMEREL